MSLINAISHEILISHINSCPETPSDTKSKAIITAQEILISLINSCAENSSDTKSKDIIASICKNLKYEEKNIAIFKIIFENKVFYPVPLYKKIFASSCINGLFELVECLLKNIDDIDIPRTIDCEAVVYLTLKKGHINVAKLLIEKKILDKSSKGELYSNGLYFACENGHIEIVKLLLEAGVKKHETCYEVIYRAAKTGQYEIVNLLLDNIQVASDKNLYNPAIYIAATNNFDNIVKLILQKRPCITRANFIPDTDINKKIISIYNELYPEPSVEISAVPTEISTEPSVEISAVPVEISAVPSNNNEYLNDLLKKLRQEMTKQNIFKISITPNSIMVTNDLKI